MKLHRALYNIISEHFIVIYIVCSLLFALFLSHFIGNEYISHPLSFIGVSPSLFLSFPQYRSICVCVCVFMCVCMCVSVRICLLFISQGRLLYIGTRWLKIIDLLLIVNLDIVTGLNSDTDRTEAIINHWVLPFYLSFFFQCKCVQAFHCFESYWK